MKNSNNIVVITGGAGGIGQECARAFKKDHLIITDYAQKDVDEVVKKLNNDGYQASGIACDITNKKDVQKLVEFTADAGQLKAIIHTAGVSGTIKDAKKVFNINLVGTDIILDSFYHIAKKNSAAILLSSMMAHTVPENDTYDYALKNPQEDNSLEAVNKVVEENADTMYNFTKRGVILLMLKNVDEWGEKGARILTVSPGVIETKMGLKAAEEHPERMEKIKNATPLKRNGKPEDVSNMVHFLASEKANFLTGTDILVDGGVLNNIKKGL
ncbi:SDR family NAD(P)-dependent oxidoreductase [Psychroflexus halocasei]|uniref:NAD(P)-dependent dehydrogenase, short-chain alcohol dehydrogenase family n=1 Tax=Psychroflexus halocasei TaxID=908615 RepID=A0A1H4DPN7_9FLAO|nr:SDR family oxidoreductase [Psychroflexus halocasei]SEA74725.1 NAD(P)-dependent dehydrogenase, short-chain alcohol dehydrogenase family [Psychroflexus halocasei]